MDLNKTALVLIDLQKEGNYGILGIDEVIKNTKKITECCRSLNIPVIYTRQINREDAVGLSYADPLNEHGEPVYYHSGTDAIEIFDDIKPLENDIVIDKYRWSAFYETSLDLILKSLNVKHLLIGGMVTDGCLMTSVFDAYFRDYQINLIKDICAATNTGAHMSSILIMCNWVYGMRVYDADELVKKLNGKEHHVWEWTEADQLKFSPENMKEIFAKLNS
ncbi:MAG: cysteine hydrolase [Firmicutes bacterium]|nr:cysteine hydrolase [Bacillota bacterium]